MSGFLAVRLEDEISELSSLGVEDRQARLNEDEDPSRSRRVEKLEAAGFQPAKAGARAPAESPRFIRLPYAGAYIVEGGSEREEEDALSILSDGYRIIRSDAMQLNSSVDIALKGTAKAPVEWPEYSGLGPAGARVDLGDETCMYVLDTGCDADHFQFSHIKKMPFHYVKPYGRYDARSVRGFDPDGHGTHVCGICFGRDVGMAPNADAWVASVIESETALTSLRRIVRALDLAFRDSVSKDPEWPKILNMSLGFPPGNSNLDDMLKATRGLMRRALEVFEILPVVAIGNEGAGKYRLPGGFPEVLSVGAVDRNGSVAGFSGSGAVDIGGETREAPDVYGYGVDVYSSYDRTTENRSRYAKLSGTSMASPYVAGIAALVGQNTRLKGARLRQEVLDRAVDINGVKVASLGAR